jgi:hypothetical protein
VSETKGVNISGHIVVNGYRIDREEVNLNSEIPEEKRGAAFHYVQENNCVNDD